MVKWSAQWTVQCTASVATPMIDGIWALLFPHFPSPSPPFLFILFVAFFSVNGFPDFFFFMSYYYWVVHPTTTTAVDSNDCILNNLHEQNRSSCADNQCCPAAAVFSAAEYNCHIVLQLTFLSFFCFSYLHFLCALPATSTSTLTSIGHSNANRCHSWVKN